MEAAHLFPAVLSSLAAHVLPVEGSPQSLRSHNETNVTFKAYTGFRSTN